MGMTPEQRKQRVAEKAGQALEQIQQAALQAAFEAAEKGEVPSLADAFAVADREVSKKPGNSGNTLPGAGPGRPKGVRNKLTNLRDAVLEAFDTVGGAAYLVKLAEGTQSDRAAFVSLMNKVLPTQINQQVEGGVRLELSWLGGRNIGTTAAQIAEQRTQVLDLERDSEGGYRIKDPSIPPAGEGGSGDDLGQDGAGDAQGKGA